MKAIIYNNATGALNYSDIIKQYDAQIDALKAKLASTQQDLVNRQQRLAELGVERGACDLDAGEMAQVVFLGRWGQFASSNECFDDNNRKQDEMKNLINVAKEEIASLESQIRTVQAQKDAAVSDNRAQIKADTIAQTERMKAEAGKAIALGQVDPEVIKAKAELEAEAGLTSNKKILYAGVILFLVLAGLVGAYVVISKSKAA